MEEFDVVVIGAGPAGLNISQLLGKSGVKVTLLESKKDLLNIQFNTLGSFIDIEKFGLSEAVIAARVTECILHSKDIHVKKKGLAYIINKRQLHKELRILPPHMRQFWLNCSYEGKTIFNHSSI